MDETLRESRKNEKPFLREVVRGKAPGRPGVFLGTQTRVCALCASEVDGGGLQSLQEPGSPPGFFSTARTAGGADAEGVCPRCWTAARAVLSPRAHSQNGTDTFGVSPTFVALTRRNPITATRARSERRVIDRVTPNQFLVASHAPYT